MADLAENMLAFCELLRVRRGFDLGHAQAREALRAVEHVGIADRERVRCALRLVCCSKAGQREIFDDAFDAFFGSDDLVRRPRHSRTQAGREHPNPPATSHREFDNDDPSARTGDILRARYSPTAAQTNAAPAVPGEGLAETLVEAGRLIAGLRLGRSRRWKPHVRGERFDLRRTLRSSLQTGGDPARIRTLGHPLRNPRVVVLLDGSRSMSDRALPLLQLAYALCRRSRRTSVFVFSTELREITRELRALPHGERRPLERLGGAWGGGTRIGACLHELVRTHAARLNGDTLVLIASDGLDEGEPAQLRGAMQTIRRRCAGIVWLNPHAGSPRFSPESRGMQAALPYLSALLDATDLHTIGTAGRYLRR